MLDKSIGRSFPPGTRAILGVLVIAIALAHSFGAAAANNTGKSLGLCKTEIAALTDGKARVKLDRVRGSKLRLRVRIPDERAQRIWCHVKDGAVRLSKLDGSPFPEATGVAAPDRRSPSVADNS